MRRGGQIMAGLVFLTTALLLMPVVRPWAVNLSVGDLLLIAVCGLLVLRGRVRMLSLLREERGWFLSGTLLLAGFMISDLIHGGRGGEAGLLGMAQYLFVVLLMPALLLGAPHPRAAFWGLLAGSVANVLAAALAWRYGWQLPGTVAGRLSGLLGNPNALAKSLAIPSILFLDLALRERARRAVWGYAGVLACMAGAVLAASFGGILAQGMGLVAYLAMLKKRRALLAIGILGAVGYGLMSSGWLAGLNDKLDERMARFYAYSSVRTLGSFEVKVALMRESLETISENPLVGKGIQDKEEDGYAELFMHQVHNWPLIVYESGGILSFAGAVGILFYLIGYVKRKGAGCRPETRAAAWAGLGVFLLNMQTNPHMYARFWWVALFVLLRMVQDEARANRERAEVLAGGAA